MKLNKIYQGDTLEVLKTFPAGSIDCVITSPPYWALRDYGVKGQLGLEPTFQEYIIKLCDIFDEIKRVLMPSGTCWVVLGDTYWGGGNNRGSTEENLSAKQCSNRGARGQCAKQWDNSFQSKCLIQIPSRFSIEMTNRGWILRNRIIWHKSNVMPSSVKDRFTVDFEEIFFFVKEKKYWFKQQLESMVLNTDVEYRHALRRSKEYTQKKPYQNNFPKKFNLNGRNKRTVWTIATKPFKEAHFAVFPEALIETPIKAGCPEKGIVLDPFMGSGTVAVVAQKLNRQWIGIDLNPEYIKMAEKRIADNSYMWNK